MGFGWTGHPRPPFWDLPGVCTSGASGLFWGWGSRVFRGAPGRAVLERPRASLARPSAPGASSPSHPCKGLRYGSFGLVALRLCWSPFGRSGFLPLLDHFSASCLVQFRRTGVAVPPFLQAARLGSVACLFGLLGPSVYSCPFSALWPACVQFACLFAPLCVGLSGGRRAAPGAVVVVVGSSSVLRALCGAALLSVGVRVWARVFCW